MGQGRVFRVIITQMLGNIMNIALGIIFVREMGMNTIGMAMATIISQIIICIVGLVLIFNIIPKEKRVFSINIFKANFQIVFIANLNLFLRTLFLTIQLNIHNGMAGDLGQIYGSVNNILIQFLLIASGIFEGVANTASAYAGHSIGEKNKPLLEFTWKMTNYYTIAIGIILSIVFIVFRSPLISLYAVNEEIANATIKYSLWLLPYLLIGGFSMTYYGIFIGAVYTKPIAISTFMSLVAFLFIYYAAVGIVQKYGYVPFVTLWFAYSIFYAVRSYGLYFCKKSLLAKAD